VARSLFRLPFKSPPILSIQFAAYYRTIGWLSMALNIRPVEAPRSTRAQRLVRRNHHGARALDVDLLGQARDRHRWAIGRKPKLTSKAPTFWRFAIAPVRGRLAALRRSQPRARSDQLALKFPRIQECDRRMPVLHRQSVGAAQGATLIAPFSGLWRAPREPIEIPANLRPRHDRQFSSTIWRGPRWRPNMALAHDTSWRARPVLISYGCPIDQTAV